MKKKTGGLTKQQVAGIVWLSVALLIFLATIFFSKKNNTPVLISDSLYQYYDTIVDKKEQKYIDNRFSGDYTQGYSRGNNQRRNNTPYPKPKRLSDSAYTPTSSPTPHRKPLSVEINTVDTTTLMLLHGIGPAYARRIVNYRDKIGGFTNIKQLLEVYGFTQELLNHIEPYITLNTDSITHIAINSIELKQLIRHPYIEYYQARDIVNLRNKGIVFHNSDDLRAVPSMTDSTLVRLLPYLDFNN